MTVVFGIQKKGTKLLPSPAHPRHSCFLRIFMSAELQSTVRELIPAFGSRTDCYQGTAASRTWMRILFISLIAMDWNLKESNPYSTFPKTMASSHPGLHKERRITHHCVIHWRQSLRIFCKGHSQKTREECSAVTDCHFSLSNQFASPERCQITKMQLKKAPKKAFYWDTV